MSIETVYSITGKLMIKDTETGRTWMSLVEDKAFRGAIEGLYQFVLDNSADADMAYEWLSSTFPVVLLHALPPKLFSLR